MKLLFEIEQYEDMKGLPFSLNLFYDNRINIFLIEESKRKLLLSSTFHNGILIEIGTALITLSDNKNNKYQIDTYENGLVYTFKKQDNQLIVDCFSEYDSTNDKILNCLFEEFLKAYVKEYKRYKEYILSCDKEAYDNRIFIMMLEQINTLDNISNKII